MAIGLGAKAAKSNLRKMIKKERDQLRTDSLQESYK